MKKLFLTLLASTFFLQANNFYTPDQLGITQQKIDEWYAYHVQKLEFNDYQIVANLINTSATAADLDSKTKRLYMKMVAPFQGLQQNAFDQHEDVNKDSLIMLNSSLTLFGKFLTARAVIFKRWKASITWINDNASQEVQNAINSMQEHLQQESLAFVQRNKQNHKNVFEKAKENAQQSIQISYVVANTYQALLEDNNPIQADNAILQDIIDLDTATKLCDALEQQSWKNLKNSALVFDSVIILQDLNYMLYTLYYKTIYTPNMFIIFDDNGILPKDKWTTPLTN